MVEGVPAVWRNIPYRYRLEGTYCETCGTAYFPPRVVCPKCRRKGKLKKMTFSGEGRIVSYTKVYVPPTGLELEVPYYLAIIQLSEGPMIIGQLVEVEDDNIHIGDKVKVIFRKMKEDSDDGLIHYGYKFKIVD